MHLPAPVTPFERADAATRLGLVAADAGEPGADAQLLQRALELDDDEKKAVATWGLMTAKPVLYCCNVGESDLPNGNVWSDAVKARAATEGAGVVILCGKIEAELAGMTDEETARTAELFLSLKGQHSLMVVEHDMSFIKTISDIVTVLCDGSVLARTDAHEREAFMAHVSHHRAPRIASHWAWLMQPLVSAYSEQPGALRYRQIEYHRMPLTAYLALDDPQALTRNDFIRLGLVTGAGPRTAQTVRDGSGNALPYGEPHLADFERRYCYDRFWSSAGAAPNTRYLCSGHALVVVGDAKSAFFTDRERGVLAQFRHQHFLLFLIAHFQKAALLMFSERLVEALKRLHVADPESVRRFKRAIRASFEGFLRFTHRYWFHDIAEQAQTRALFRMTVDHLEIDPLYAEVKERTADMNSYLDADSLRRQANTVVRLTVVTIFGLIGTITTGFLGMNLLAEAESPLSERLLYFALVFVVSTALTMYTMVKSKRLSDFLDAVSDVRLSGWTKVKALAAVWRRGAE